MPSKPPHLVGVTGGIGSGKSSVCTIFAELGRTVISADNVAHHLTERDPAVRDAIMKAFGGQIYDARGLKRKELASIVFSDPVRRKKLDKIVHPRVFDAIGGMVSQLPVAATLPYVIIEAALIFESGMDTILDATVLVRASEEHRLARIEARDGLSEAEVRMRFQSQNRPETNSRKAGYIIENDGPAEALFEKVRFIDRILTLSFASP
jgi:dephospho-CoA kinase